MELLLRDDQAAAAVLRRVDADRRAVLGTSGYFYAHIAILLGIVISAAGVLEVLADPSGRLTTAAALALGGGVALFYAGDARFRQALQIAPTGPRLLAALAALATLALGRWVSGPVQLGGLVAVAVATLLVEHLHILGSSATGQEDMVGRALGLGAVHVDVGQLPQESHVVLVVRLGATRLGGASDGAVELADPDDYEFLLLTED